MVYGKDIFKRAGQHRQTAGAGSCKVFGDLSLVIIALIEIAVSASIAAGYKNFKKSHERKVA